MLIVCFSSVKCMLLFVCLSHRPLLYVAIVIYVSLFIMLLLTLNYVHVFVIDGNNHGFPNTYVLQHCKINDFQL